MTETRGGVRTRAARVFVGVGCLTAAVALSGCVTVAEHRKLEAQVAELQKSGRSAESSRRLADLAAEIEQMRGEVARLEGRVEVAEKKAGDALVDAEKARREVAAVATGSPGAAAVATAEVAADATAGAAESAEVLAYREAYAAWRVKDSQLCIDRFRKFLQSYPASDYADDAGFWMADCHAQEGDYKNAVLRFDDVVRNYQDGNKAPDALYRQGESLLKLGPGFHEAARRAFERVVKEYPDSSRAEEAREQLKMMDAAS